MGLPWKELLGFLLWAACGEHGELGSEHRTGAASLLSLPAELPSPVWSRGGMLRAGRPPSRALPWLVPPFSAHPSPPGSLGCPKTQHLVFEASCSPGWLSPHHTDNREVETPQILSPPRCGVPHATPQGPTRKVGIQGTPCSPAMLFPPLLSSPDLSIFPRGG